MVTMSYSNVELDAFANVGLLLDFVITFGSKSFEIFKIENPNSKLLKTFRVKEPQFQDFGIERTNSSAGRFLNWFFDSFENNSSSSKTVL